jgi:hypothetical protein
VLADDAVPVGRVLLVEEGLDELGNFLLGLLLIDGSVDLLLNIVLHVLVHLADYPGNVTLCHFPSFLI